MLYIKEYFKYAFDFVGVTKRKPFWITMLIVFAVNIVCSLLCFLSDYFLILELLVLVVGLVPTLSITARRLHDTDRTAFNLFWLLFPFVGVVIIMVYCSEKTKYIIEEKKI